MVSLLTISWTPDMQYHNELRRDCSSRVYHILVLETMSQSGEETDGKSHSQKHHGRLHTTLKETQEESYSHERGKVGRSSRTRDDGTPDEDVDGEHLGQGELLQQIVLGVLSGEDTNVEDCAEPLILVDG